MAVPLAHGDLLLMRNFQEDFEHALPKRLKVDGPRLNFTFRRCVAG
jgi:alkylated DNA repair dioxygenase AlkB